MRELHKKVLVRQCKKCLRTFPTTSKYFSSTKNQYSEKVWFRNRCKECDNKYHVKWVHTQEAGYISYKCAKNRCNSKKDLRYNDYGGRGIKFLLPPFKEVLKILGPKPEGMSIDRINNNGHYEIGNVRWATVKEQAANKRNTKLTQLDVAVIRGLWAAKAMTQTEIAKKYDVWSSTISGIVNRKYWR